MSILDQVDVDQLADGAPLAAADIQALLTGTADERSTRPAAAWLHAYRLARWLGFRESTAQRQAGPAWDRAVEDLALELSIDVLERRN